MAKRSLELPPRIARLILLVLVAGGAALRLIQFLAGRSLWIDEAALALNLMRKSYASLAGHLDYGQMAPIGFLWLEKAVTSVFGTGEVALRLVPFAAGLIALALFARLSWILLPPAGAVVAVGLFAVNHRLVYYSSEVKQYSFDVAVTVALLTAAIALPRDRLSAGRLAVLALIGTLAGWSSHPACFVLAGIGASMIWTAYRRRDRRAFGAAAGLGGWWLVTVVPVLMLERRNLSAEDSFILGNYWTDGFPSTSEGLGGVLRWLGGALGRALSYLFEFELESKLTIVLVAAIVLGGVSLARRRMDVFLLVVAPIVFMLAGAMAHALPFSRRLILFLIPLALLLVGEFIGALSRRAAPWGPAAAWMIGAALLVPPVWAIKGHLPERVSELRPVLETMRQYARPGDAVYVYHGAIRAYQYYQPRLRLPFQDVSLGCCSRYQWRVDVEALRKLGGRNRVWLILSSWDRGQASFVLLAADRFGHRRVAIRAHGAAAYLYELPEVPTSAFEDVLAVIPPDRDRPNWRCSGGILPEPSCGVH